MPFGRCGLNGLPREHIQVFAAREAWLDLLTREGPQVVAVKPGQPVAIEPQSVVRLRARPQPGGRVLVAFQTQDRTPLMGNAAPFTLDGEIPERWDERLRKGHDAFTEVAGLWAGDRPAYEAALERFFGSMAEKLEGDAAVAAVCEVARGAGSYDAADEGAFFDCQEGDDRRAAAGAHPFAQDPEAVPLSRDVRRHRDVVQLFGVRGPVYPISYLKCPYCAAMENHRVFLPGTT